MSHHMLYNVLFSSALVFFGLSINSHAQSAGNFTLTSTSLHPGGSIPTRYSCDGTDTQPDLAWANAPANTQSFALILSDPDAPSGAFYHWVLYNIPHSVNSLPEAMSSLPSGALAGKNSWNKAQYNGPCPPQGSTHHYVFTLYALDTNLNLPAGANAQAVLRAMQTHILGQATFTMLYGR